MASRGVSVLKFVGTVSLGLLTGLSYTLSTLTVPTLLTLPSASTAARAFESLANSAKSQLQMLASVSGSAFLIAFFLSPRSQRHPYLLYTSLLVLGSRLVTSELVAPYLYLTPTRPAISSPLSPAEAAAAHKKKQQRDHARMEASYEVLGATGSDLHSEGTAGSGEEMDGEDEAAAAASLNGEQVRRNVETFLKKQVVETAVAGLGFLIAVIGIWGDGAVQVFQSETFIIEA